MALTARVAVEDNLKKAAAQAAFFILQVLH